MNVINENGQPMGTIDQIKGWDGEKWSGESLHEKKNIQTFERSTAEFYLWLIDSRVRGAQGRRRST